MSIVVLLVVSLRTFAGPDLPVVSGPVADFTGDQSWGIWPASYWTCPPVYTYNVYDLTTDITPAAGVEGILIQHYGANGGNGGGSILGDGGNGGNGAGGQNLTVSFVGDTWGIMTMGDNALGISARSEGGSVVMAVGLPAYCGHMAVMAELVAMAVLRLSPATATSRPPAIYLSESSQRVWAETVVTVAGPELPPHLREVLVEPGAMAARCLSPTTAASTLSAIILPASTQ